MLFAKNLFTLIFTVAILFETTAQTEVQGGIFEHTTWTLDKSPYVVVGDIVVFEGFSLTIEPGVEVLINQGLTIEIRNSTFKAVGTNKNPIRIRSILKDDNKEYWKGFLVKGFINEVPDLQIEVAFCYIANAEKAFDLDEGYKSYLFENTHFQFNRYVRYGTVSGESHFNTCVFSDNYLGFEESYDDNDYIDDCVFTRNYMGAKGGIITNSKFYDNYFYGVYVYNTLINCQIYNNPIGVISHSHSNTMVVNNYIYNNEIGVQLDAFWNNESIKFEGNSICNNETWNVDYKYENAADLTKNCWCLETEEQIKNLIRDAEEDLSLGLISVDPNYSNCPYSMTMAVSPSLKRNSELNVYPNPALTEIQIDFDGNDYDKGYKIFDAQLKVVDQGQLSKRIDVSQLTPGIYTISIINGTKDLFMTTRFVKF